MSFKMYELQNAAVATYTCLTTNHAPYPWIGLKLLHHGGVFVFVLQVGEQLGRVDGGHELSAQTTFCFHTALDDLLAMKVSPNVGDRGLRDDGDDIGARILVSVDDVSPSITNIISCLADSRGFSSSSGLLEILSMKRNKLFFRVRGAAIESNGVV
jgi:hypothetical protein